MKHLVIAAICLISLAACATPVTYGPAASSRGSGFSEQKIEHDRIRVTFRGAGPDSQINDYALLRAADLAVSEGYDWFRVTERVTRQNGYSGSSLSVGVGGMSFGRHSATAVGVGTGVPLSGGPALVTSLEVLMGKGPKPGDGDVYDARGVQRSLRART